jgi:hypothetical protein
MSKCWSEKVDANSISKGWLQAFLGLMETGTGYISPLVVELSIFDDLNSPIEDLTVRQALDRALEKVDEANCNTVANTIFPQTLWHQELSRHEFYQRFYDIWPRVHHYSSNRRGTYFQRLIAYQHEGKCINQLEHIITTYHRGNHRRSAL